MGTDGLGSHVNTVEVRTAKASFDVRAVLPGLAKQSRRWGRAAICPMCNGYKSAEAKTCRPCYGRRKSLARANRRQAAGPVVLPAPRAGNYGATFQHGAREGHAVVQPVRRRWVKDETGTWTEVVA